MAKPELSLNAGVAAAVVGAAPAGDGVAGMPPANRFDWVGAAGGAGVGAAAGAGVEGGFEDDGVEAGAGAVFGYRGC